VDFERFACAVGRQAAERASGTGDSLLLWLENQQVNGERPGALQSAAVFLTANVCKAKRAIRLLLLASDFNQRARGRAILA